MEPRMEQGTMPPPGTRRTRIIRAVLLAVVLVAATLAVAVATDHNPLIALFPRFPPGGFCGAGSKPTAPTPHPPEITYIGKDGNVWDMSWPNGTPRHFTSDALQGSQTNDYTDISYGDLAWSPDGTHLAVIRSAEPISQEKRDLLLFSPDGTLVQRTPLDADTLDGLAWSPDSCALAYFSPGYPGRGDLVLLNARTGATEGKISYDFNHYVVCDPVDVPLANILYFLSFDTFAWASDQQSLLVWYDCVTGASGRVDLNTGDATPDYPQDARYRPGAPPLQEDILGLWSTGSTDDQPVLGLTDAAGNHLRTLVTGPTYSYPPKYADTLGQAAWNSDGQAIYYTYEDSIWRINVDGSGAHLVVAGTMLDRQGNATVEVVPTPSPDGQMLLYLQLQGNENPRRNEQSPQAPTSQWYVAEATGAHPVPLPQGTLSSTYGPIDALWRPGT